MTTNRLAANEGRYGGKVGVEILENLAAELNRSHAMRAMGRHYFVKREIINGEVKHKLDWQNVQAV